MSDYERFLQGQLREQAERVGRLTYFVEELVALALVRDEAPAGFLRERLQVLAEQATSHDLARLESTAERRAYLRQQIEFWRQRHGTRPRRAATPDEQDGGGAVT